MTTLSDDGASQIETVVVPRSSDLGGFEVRRALPSAQKRTVGPFVFLDHMGPVEFRAGSGIDVRPHPHIGLSTVTYLYEGSMVHRDGAGHTQTILPGEVNWMTAGRGIVHSERSSPESRQADQRLCGLQIWVGCPSSTRRPIPVSSITGWTRSRWWKARACAPRWWPASCSARLPASRRCRRCSTGISRCARARPWCCRPSMKSARPIWPRVRSSRGAGVRKRPPGRVRAGQAGADPRGERCYAVLGGEPLDGPRFLWWNFVSSSKDRIEQAKEDWQRDRFGQTVPGDETEFIPLPPPKA